MAVALGRVRGGRGAGHGRRPRRHDHRSPRRVLGHNIVDLILVVGAVGHDRGERRVDLLEVEAFLGTTRPPPDELVDDGAFRRAYYFASQRFVRFLIERKGMVTFLALYEDPDPESAFPRLYGATRTELVRGW